MTSLSPEITALEPASQTMLAAALKSPGHFEMCEVRRPQPQSNEVRIRLQGCGVCASNIPPYEGRDWFRYPMPPGQLGHEGWGRIDAVGPDVTRWRIGQRVAFLSERAYAQYDVARQDQVVALPDELDGQPFPAEPLGCAVNIFRRAEVKPGQSVAILGIGFLGSILTRLASDAGARVIAIARRPFALDVASRMGAARTILMEDHSTIIDQVRQLTGGQFCEVVIECVGKQWPLDLAGELTRERGRLVVAGYHQDGLRQVNVQLWNWRGIDVINAHERDPRTYVAGMTRAVEMVAAGELDPSPLYTHRFPLEKLGEALDMTRTRPEGFMKALVMCS